MSDQKQESERGHGNGPLPGRNVTVVREEGKTKFVRGIPEQDAGAQCPMRRALEEFAASRNWATVPGAGRTGTDYACAWVGPMGPYSPDSFARQALQTPCPLEAERAIDECEEECTELCRKVDRLEAERDRLRAALEMFYDKWENGDPCFEDVEALDGPLGNAVRLSGEEENELLALIPSRPSLQLGALKVRHATNEKLRAALKGAVEALQDLDARVGEAEKPINACLQISHIHGCPYNGPNWKVERERAAAALSAAKEAM